MYGPDRVPYIDYLPDDADDLLATHPVMARPCADCAYTPGTEASRNPITSRDAKMCADARCGFWCHKAVNPNMSEIQTHLCAGWHAALSKAPDHA